MLVLLFAALLWAAVATVLLVRNPLPFPDRGHRLFGVPNQVAHDVVLRILDDAGLPLRFRFRTGRSTQALLWDNETVLHLFDDGEALLRDGLTGNGISVPVSDPEATARDSIRLLEAKGFRATLLDGFADYLPPNHLTIVESDAFLGWVLVFRRHVLKMPRPEQI